MSRRGAGALALVAVTAFAVTAGCGGEEGEDDRVVDTIERLQADVAAGRLEAACASLDSDPIRQIGSVGHGRTPTTCVRDLRELLVGSRWEGRPEPDVALRGADQPKIVDVHVAPSGSTARAAMTMGDDPFDVTLVKRGDRWRLADLFGAVGPVPEALQ